MKVHRGAARGPYRSSTHDVDAEALHRLRRRSAAVARRFAFRRRWAARWEAVVRRLTPLLGAATVLLTLASVGPALVAVATPRWVGALALAGVIGGLMTWVFSLGRRSG